ncbi:hypothetical protein RRF57_009497 [Xylaria bambusicola]|uniref:Pterin-binding domain-containing protein n=1 Tax=Xylaria bambusicola TaxID=326684 RepID=A0AAN7UV28_9PEZI
MQVGIPQLAKSLMLEPVLGDEKTVDNASSVLGATSLLGSLNHLVSDDFTVRLGNLVLIQFARDTLLDEIA